jgi:hypothetical protein
VQQLRGITHVRCIDVVRALFQQSSGRRWIWLEIEQHDDIRKRRYSFNPLTQLKTWESSQEEERKRENEMSQHPLGGFI